MNKGGDATSRPPSAPQRSRALVKLLALLLIVLGIIGSAAIQSVRLQRRFDRQRQAQLALAEVEHLADSVRFGPTELVHGLPFDMVVFDDNAVLRDRAAKAALSLQRLSPLGASVDNLVANLDLLVSKQMDMLRLGNVVQASNYDQTAVSSAYARLDAAITLANTQLATKAQQAGRQAERDTLGVVVGAGLLLVLVLLGFERGRRRRERSDVQRLTLEDMAERFRALLEHSSDITIVVEPHGRIIYEAPSVHGVLGYGDGLLNGSNLSEWVHDDDLSLLPALCEAGAHRCVELRLRHADGDWRTCEATASDLTAHQGIGGVVLNVRDVTERRVLEDELRHRAFHDALTGLANRALFTDRIAHALERGSRYGDPVGVVVLDLDHFKDINDNLGHGAGDEVLLEVARRIAASVRPGDTVARLGGDEFAILLDQEVTQGVAIDVAERVRALVAEPIAIAAKLYRLDVSAGVAMGRAGRDSQEELVRNADVAMYAAKAAGKGCVVPFESSMRIQAAEQLALGADLEGAVARGEMCLHFQPIVGLDTQEVHGMEALVRWQHPEFGLVPPLSFIPLAERSGAIHEIGRWVLAEACRQVIDWDARVPAMAGLDLHVNVSAKELSNPSYASAVGVTLAAAGLAPTRLTLEITESELVQHAAEVTSVLHALRATGVRIALDDFGTGYSSLAYLWQFPVDVLKIDKAFVQSSDAADAASLLRTIVTLGQSMGLVPVAEGVEDPAQLEELLAAGCTSAQGFLFSRPLTADAAEQMFAGGLAHTRPALDVLPVA